MNSFGTYNMPDGEIYTGPVEDSVNGWVKFTYPANYGGTSVEGAELTFSNGRVETAKADKNQDFLLKTLDSDAGSRYLGEFAIGTNFDIQQFHRQYPVRREDRRLLPHGARRRLPGNWLEEQERHPLGHDLRHAHRLRRSWWTVSCSTRTGSSSSRMLKYRCLKRMQVEDRKVEEFLNLLLLSQSAFHELTRTCSNTSPPSDPLLSRRHLCRRAR